MDKSIWLDTIAIELIGENRVVSTHQSENPLSEMRLMLRHISTAFAKIIIRKAGRKNTVPLSWHYASFRELQFLL